MKVRICTSNIFSEQLDLTYTVSKGMFAEPYRCSEDLYTLFNNLCEKDVFELTDKFTHMVYELQVINIKHFFCPPTDGEMRICVGIVSSHPYEEKL